MISQSLYHRRCRRIDEHTHIRHSLTPLLTKKSTIALHKLNKETLYLMLEVWRHQVDTAPRCEIDRTEKEPDLLPLGTIYWPHSQFIGAIIKKAWVAKMSDQRL